MKRINLLIAFALVLLLSDGCKKEKEEVDTTVIKSCSFTIDGIDYSYNDGTGGFSAYPYTSSLHVTDNITQKAFGIEFMSESSNQKFKLQKGDLFHEDNSSEQFYSFFELGNVKFASDTTAVPDGITIKWVDDNNKAFSSDRFNQTNGQFTFQELEKSSGMEGTGYRFKAVFNCTLESNVGTTHVLTNGVCSGLFVH